METEKGIFIIITGPSGVGKTTVTNELIKRIPSSTRLITTTTRAIRTNEEHGIDYNFISVEEFLKKKSRGDFFEYAKVYDNYYGSENDVLRELLNKYSFVFCVVDVDGAKTIKAKLDKSIAIFISPNSIEELTMRLFSRNDTHKTDIEKRTKIAKSEIEQATMFDFIIKNKNGELQKTINNTLIYLNKLMK